MTGAGRTTTSTTLQLPGKIEHAEEGVASPKVYPLHLSNSLVHDGGWLQVVDGHHASVERLHAVLALRYTG